MPPLRRDDGSGQACKLSAALGQSAVYHALITAVFAANAHSRESMPFGGKRIFFGGFVPIVET
jgi:uncharacterized protein YbaA (DUF1428 family)